MNRPKQEDGEATLVVADGELAERLGRVHRGPIVSVENYLDALGEMSRRSVAAVIGRIHPMASSMEATVRVLRRMVPHGRLMLTVDADEEPQAMRAVRLGFHEYLVRPCSVERVEQALGGGSESPKPESQPQTTPSACEKHDPATVRDPEKESADAPSQTSEDPLPHGRGSSGASHTRSGSSGSTHNQQSSAEPLGDIDLIEQLLRDRRGLKDLALRLIRQRLGDEGVRWSDRPAEGKGEVCAPVAFGGPPLGYLVGASAPPRQLAGYAGWLARWLALDRHVADLSDLALRDELTGVWNRRYFDRFLASTLERARLERFRVTLMIYDIDDFKSYNDRYGHQAGDDILREAARLMQSVVREHDVVARIGGDEFAVVFWDAEQPRREHSEHPHSVRAAAERFQRAISEHRFPKLAEWAPGTLTISGGLAGYPWDGRSPEGLIDIADRMLLESKRQGKNVLTFGYGALRESDADASAAE